MMQSGGVRSCTRSIQAPGKSISAARLASLASHSDGEQGLAVAHDQRPDLILMDLSLPVLDGWQATRRLKESEETRTIPVIALSTHAMPGDREKALEAGCDDYDAKPVNLPRLLAKIRALLPEGPSHEPIGRRHLGRRRQRRQSVHAVPPAPAAGVHRDRGEPSRGRSRRFGASPRR
jgi:CheY-like chemotaxis protein